MTHLNKKKKFLLKKSYNFNLIASFVLNRTRWNKNYLLSILDNHLIHYPSPINLNYAWSFGSVAGICLVIQMLSGIFLAMHYTPHTTAAMPLWIVWRRTPRYPRRARGRLLRSLAMDGSTRQLASMAVAWYCLPQPRVLSLARRTGGVPYRC